MQMEVSGKKKTIVLSLYIYKHCLVTQIYLEKLLSWSENECKLKIM